MPEELISPENMKRESEKRRRSDRSHKAILNATLSLLDGMSYRDITIEGIAAKAGVGKQTIYRWWPSKAAVILEALLEDASISITAPDSGNLREDLELYLIQAYRTISGRLGKILRGLTSEVLLDDKFKQEFLRSYERPWRENVATLLRRASSRGEIPAGYDEEIILDMLFGFKWLRLIFGHASLDPDLAPRIADMAIALARC